MSNRLPSIVMSRSDYDRLSSLAEAIAEKSPAVGEFLMRELDRARILPPEHLGTGTVSMGSRVEFAYGETDRTEAVTLVFPGEENIAMGRVSILTPVGAALIGLSEGQSIAFPTRRGEERTLTVLRVHPPSDVR